MCESVEKRMPWAFHVMAKPIGPICNLQCAHCFYLEKVKLYPEDKAWAMSPEVLERYVRDYIAAQQAPEVVFAWQGGEPTLLGLDFFRRAVALQRQYADGKVIHNALQTNGMLLDDEWAAFLAEHRFLVGVSLDGPKALHDRFRRDKSGRGSFDRVMAGIGCLKRHKVEFNTLTCVQRENAKRPLDVYRFLRESGVEFIQFIPIVERINDTREDGLQLVGPDAPEADIAPWSVDGPAFGDFMIAIFDEWVRRDVGTIFVQMFDVALEAWVGRNPSLCVFSATCGQAMALEHNGDLYSCDHYVYPEYHLGNIMETPIEEMVSSPFQRRFGELKHDALPAVCRECPVRFACNGGCPKHRFCTTPEGEAGWNYLCAGYLRFFQHIDPYMRAMARELRVGRPPANVMRMLRAEEHPEKPEAPRANDPCPCGSGRKFKKCCGRVV